MTNISMRQMNSRKLLLSIFFSSFLLLLLVSGSSADPRDRRMPPTHYPPMMRDTGMIGGSEYMDITGSVIVGDGITISLTVQPSDEMIERMDDHMADAPMDMPERSIEDMTNTLNVTLYELVEFEDVNDNGYDANDTIVSTYALDSSSLGDVNLETVDEITTYTVESKDDVFTMIIEVNVTDNLPHDWKWSLLIEYPFESSTSELAMVHEIVSTRTNMIDSRHRYSHRARPGDMGFNPENYNRYMNQSMFDQNSHIPIVFSWDSTAIVDGTDADIVATSFGDSFALSLPQGAIIDYDPRVSMDTDSYSIVENDLADLFGDLSFADIINSPTLIGLSIAVISVAIVIILMKKR